MQTERHAGRYTDSHTHTHTHTHTGTDTQTDKQKVGQKSKLKHREKTRRCGLIFLWWIPDATTTSNGTFPMKSLIQPLSKTPSHPSPSSHSCSRPQEDQDCMSVCVSMCLSVCVCLSICLSAIVCFFHCQLYLFLRQRENAKE